MHTGAVDMADITSVKYRYGEIIDRLVANGRTAGGEELGALFSDNAHADLTEIPGMPPMQGTIAIVSYFAEVIPQHIKWNPED
jgi:hypothetical protein